MPEDEEKKTGLCPICDFRVDIDAKRCPECKADLTVFGVKTGEDEGADVNIPEYEESLEKLLGEIGKKDEKKEHELFEEIMAAVDKTNSKPREGVEVEAGYEEEPVEGGQEVAEEGAVMFECPLCNTLVSEDAKSCPGCGAIFAEEGEEEVSEGEAGVEAEEAYPAEIPEYEEEYAPAEEPQMVEEAAEEGEYEAMEEALPEEMPPSRMKKKFKLSIKRKKDRAIPEKEPIPFPAVEEKPPAVVEKDEKALHRELAGCVAEVKPLLADARKIGVNVSEGRKLIDQAIAAGKQRDFNTAISLVKESERIIQETINEHINGSIQTAKTKIETLKRSGADVKELNKMVSDVYTLLNQGNYNDAAILAKDTADKIEDELLKLKAGLKKKEYVEKEEEVDKKIKALIELIKKGEEVKVNVKNAKSLLTQARVAIKKHEWDKASDLLNQAKEDFLKELPKQLTEIITNSKPVLYRAKMQGVNIKSSIKLLKTASSALKLNNYIEALDAIKSYKAEMKQYME